MSGNPLAEGLLCSLSISLFGAFPHIFTPWFSFLGEKRLQREKAEQALENPEDLRGPTQFPVLKQGRSPYKRSFDEGDIHPQAKKKKIDLIFKDVLEASLESGNVEARQLALSTLWLAPQPLGWAMGLPAIGMGLAVWSRWAGRSIGCPQSCQLADAWAPLGWHHHQDAAVLALRDGQLAQKHALAPPS